MIYIIDTWDNKKFNVYKAKGVGKGVEQVLDPRTKQWDNPLNRPQNIHFNSSREAVGVLKALVPNLKRIYHKGPEIRYKNCQPYLFEEDKK